MSHFIYIEIVKMLWKKNEILEKVKMLAHFRLSAKNQLTNRKDEDENEQKKQETEIKIKFSINLIQCCFCNVHPKNTMCFQFNLCLCMFLLHSIFSHIHLFHAKLKWLKTHIQFTFDIQLDASNGRRKKYIVYMYIERLIGTFN